MTTEIILKKNIELFPSELNIDYENNILAKLKNSEASKNIGYILDAISIVKIESLPINRKSNPVFSVSFKALVFKPEIGVKLKCKILEIHGNSGVLLEYKPNSDILFSLNTIYAVKSENDIKMQIGIKSFKYKEKEFTKGDMIDVQITQIKYKKHIYSFICKFL